jgi:hypothetical protein
MKHMKGHSLLFPELINKPMKVPSDRKELALYGRVHKTTTAVVDDFIDRFTTIKRNSV